jgi:hypothetical protein
MLPTPNSRLCNARVAVAELSRERFVDHDGQRRAGAVAIVEHSTVDRRHAFSVGVEVDNVGQKARIARTRLGKSLSSTCWRPLSAKSMCAAMSASFCVEDQ